MALQACNKTKVLVVDEEVTVRNILSMILRTRLPALDVETATNGVEALAAFKKEHHALICMDIRMPLMKGDEAFDQINEFCKTNEWEEPAVVFCTGFALPEGLKKSIRESARHTVLYKPLNTNDFLKAVTDRL